MPINRSINSPFGIQASAEKYYSPNYLSPQRLTSVSIQLSLCCETGVRSFIDIGSGNNLLVWLLRKNGKVAYSLDHNVCIEPDLAGVLPQLPLASRAVEASMSFQVLEHLPFELVKLALLELTRVSSQWVIISIPDRTIEPNHISLRMRLARSFYRTLKFPPRWKTRVPAIHREHFWELGNDHLTANEIVQIATTCGLETRKHFRNPLFTYHHFFLFEKQDEPSKCKSV